MTSTQTEEDIIYVELEEFDEGMYKTNLAPTSQNGVTAM